MTKPKLTLAAGQEILHADNIGDIDGGIARAVINREIGKAIADLYDRGSEDGKSRVVTIQVEAKIYEGHVVFGVAAAAKLPPARTGNTLGKFRGDGENTYVIFQAANPENPDQPTFNDVGE